MTATMGLIAHLLKSLKLTTLCPWKADEEGEESQAAVMSIKLQPAASPLLIV